MLAIRPTSISDVKVLETKVFFDDRGSFTESYNRSRFYDHGIEIEFVQDNESNSRRVGTIRGLHFQTPPYAQAKLVRVISGRILDIAVDLRLNSQTYGLWISEELSADNGKQLLIPEGFAHGFCTLEPDCRVLYKVSSPYNPDADLGIIWNDPDLAIDWPVGQSAAILSDKDRRLPNFNSLTRYFV